MIKVIKKPNQSTEVRVIEPLNEKFSGLFSTLEYTVTGNTWQLTKDFEYFCGDRLNVIPAGFTIVNIRDIAGETTLSVCGNRLIRSIFAMAHMKSNYCQREDMVSELYHILKHEGYPFWARYMISFGFKYI